MDGALVFSTESYGYLADAVASIAGAERAAVEISRFPDGERFQRLKTPADGRDVVVVSGTTTDAETLALCDLVHGLVACGARSLVLLLAYFGYSTMDRAGADGEVVAAKSRARLLSSIPAPPGGVRIVLTDPHTDALAFYFEGNMRVSSINPQPLILSVAARLAGDQFVLASTDLGRAKWVQRAAREARVPAAIAVKRRISAEKTEVLSLLADVRGRTVVVYDDMIRSGASLLSAGEAYRDAGASRMFAVATHGVLPEGALARLEASGLFERIVVTDSHPRALEQHGRALEVESIAPVLANHALARIHAPPPPITSPVGRR